MPAQQLRRSDSPQTSQKQWYVIRCGSRRRKTQLRRWRRIHARSSAAVSAFAPLFVLAWLGTGILGPHGHMAAGAVLIFLLGAEIASVIALLVSDFMLQYLHADR